MERSDIERVLARYGNHPSRDAQVVAIVLRKALENFEALFPRAPRQTVLGGLPESSEPYFDRELALRRWNAIAEKHGLPQARNLTEERAKKLAQRLGEHPDLWNRVEETLKNPGSLLKHRKAWFTLDFVIERAKAQRIVEGVYMDRAPLEAPSAPYKAPEPPRDAVAVEEVKGLLEGYLARRNVMKEEAEDVNGTGGNGRVEAGEAEVDGTCPF